MQPSLSPRVRWIALVLATCAACGHGGGGHGGGTDATAPHGLGYAGAPAVYLLATPAPALVPAVEGTVLHWSITPALPAGLELDAASGVISGTPSAPALRREYTVVASNTAGAAQCELELAVVEPSRFAYLASREDGTISSFAIDFASGELRRTGFLVPPAEESGPERVVLDPSGRFAFVPNLATKNVSVYRVDAASGALVRGTPVPVGSGPHALAVDPSGRFACVASRSGSELALFSIDSATGALSAAGAPLATSGTPAAIAFDPSGRFLFAALAGPASSIETYALDAANGALASAGPALALGGAQPTAIVVDPARNNVYALLAASAGVLTLFYDGVTGFLSASPVAPTGASPSAIVFDPTGRFAWVANAGQGEISCFRTEGPGGELVPTGTLACAEEPLDLEVDPLGRHLYAVGRAQGALERYSISPETGLLAFEDSIATRERPVDLAIGRGVAPVVWIPRTVHAANLSSASVSTFTVSPASGALSPHGSPLLSGLEPVSVALDPQHRWLYVANRLSQTLTRFALDSATGTPLEGSAPSTIEGEPTHVAIDPSGRFLFACTRGADAEDDGWLSTFSIAPGTGALTLIERREVGLRPSWVGTDPTGTFLYVANNGSETPGTSSIAVFRIATVTGELSLSVPKRYVPGVWAIGFHPGGRHAYAAMRSADITIHYAVDRETGDLVFENGARAGFGPSAVAITPDGRFACVAYYDATGSGSVAVYRIDPVDAHLVVPAQIFLDGTHPLDVAIEPGGRFVYVANSGSDTISVAAIDATGGLSFGTPVMTGGAPSALAIGAVTQ